MSFLHDGMFTQKFRFTIDRINIDIPMDIYIHSMKNIIDILQLDYKEKNEEE